MRRNHAEFVVDGVTNTGFAHRREHVGGFRQAGGEGFFTQDVTTGFGGGHDNVVVESARNGDADDVEVHLAQHPPVIVT